MSIIPVGVWGLHVPAEAGPVPAASEDYDENSNALFRITMAALDPTAKPLDKDAPKRATLKILRRKFNPDDMLGSDSEEEDEDEDDQEDDEEDEDSPDEKAEVAKKGKEAKLSKKEKKEAIKKTMQALAAEKMDVDADKEDDEDDSDEEDEDGSYEIEEFVMCTLDPEKHYQQTLDVTVGEDEEVMFQVIGNYDIYLTGNLVIQDSPAGYDDEDSEDEEDYDLSPSEEELLYGNGAESEEESEDDLDDIADPRIQEVDTDEEEKPEAKKLTKAEKKALKRTADELEAEATPEKKLSKKQLKKLKANDGKPVEKAANETPDKKKVQFAKELEQGPSSAEKKPEKKDKKEKKEEKKSGQTRVVDGVTIEDKTVGKGPAAKPGNRIEMRYIGKLPNGKQFDSNVKGKPFSFKLGAGDVIKGWDIGVKGMQIGGERRITIPPAQGYGKKNLPGIPANSTLIFDVKLLSLK